MKIMTFNTQHCLNYIERKIDFKVMADAIKQCDADIVGLNEMYEWGETAEYEKQTAVLAELTGLKHHYLDLMQPYSYDTGDTQTLEIAYTSTGLHDLHQNYSLGNGDVDWIERKRTELEQELGREIYALF